MSKAAAAAPVSTSGVGAPATAVSEAAMLTTRAAMAVKNFILAFLDFVEVGEVGPYAGEIRKRSDTGKQIGYKVEEVV